MQVVFKAPEKKDTGGGRGRGKRNRGSVRAEDLSKGGVDGGMSWLIVFPFPVMGKHIHIEGRTRETLTLAVPWQKVGHTKCVDSVYVHTESD